MKSILFNACCKALLTPLLLTSMLYAQTQLPEAAVVKAPSTNQFIDSDSTTGDVQNRACGFNPGHSFASFGSDTKLCTPCYLAGCFTINSSGDVIASPGCAYTVQRIGAAAYAVSFNIPFCNPTSALVFGSSTAIRLIGSGASGITLSVPPVSGMNQTACFIVVPVS